MPISDPTYPTTSLLSDAQTATTDLNNNALAVVEIMHAFGNLSDPVRQRLLGLLQAVYETKESDIY